MASYDIAVWELDDPRKADDPDLEPTKIWGEKHPFIPRKGEEIQMNHALYEVVKVTYDLSEDYITLLVVRTR